MLLKPCLQGLLCF